MLSTPNGLIIFRILLLSFSVDIGCCHLDISILRFRFYSPITFSLYRIEKEFMIYLKELYGNIITFLYTFGFQIT